MLPLALTLTFILLVLGFFAKDKSVVIFCKLTFIANVIGYYIPDIQGLLYYIGDSYSNLLSIILISNLIVTDKLTLKLQFINLLIIFANLMGWVIYMLCVPPYFYNAVCAAIYIYAIIVIANQGGFKNVRDITMDSWKPWIPSSYFTCSSKIQRNKEESHP